MVRLGLQKSLSTFFIYFMGIFLPVYTNEYGLKNFLYFCDIALFLTLLGVLSSDPETKTFFFSSALSGILGFGSFSGISEYMFNPKLSLFLRAISFFHFWLPFFLLFNLVDTGFDPRGGYGWSIIASFVLVVSYLVSPLPGEDHRKPRNINKVFGLSDEVQQSLMHPWLWLLCLIVCGPLLLYMPSAFFLHSILGTPEYMYD